MVWVVLLSLRLAKEQADSIFESANPFRIESDGRFESWSFAGPYFLQSKFRCILETVHEMSNTVCLCHQSNVLSIFYSTANLNFNLLFTKSDALISIPECFNAVSVMKISTLCHTLRDIVITTFWTQCSHAQFAHRWKARNMPAWGEGVNSDVCLSFKIETKWVLASL